MALYLPMGVVGAFLSLCGLVWAYLHAGSQLQAPHLHGISATPPRPPLPPRAERRFRRLVALAMALPFLPLAAILAASAAANVQSLTALAVVEGSLVLALSLQVREVRGFDRAVRAELALGYTSFRTTPFGDPIRGLWFLGADGRPIGEPLPAGPARELDAIARRAFDWRLQHSVPPRAWTPPPKPRGLLPGRPASWWLRAGALSGGLGALSFYLFAPAVFVSGLPGEPFLGLAMGGMITWTSIGTVFMFRMSRQAHAEEAAGYTTLDGDDQMTLRGTFTAWYVLHTDLLWQLDPSTGAVIRSPILPGQRGGKPVRPENVDEAVST